MASHNNTPQRVLDAPELTPVPKTVHTGSNRATRRASGRRGFRTYKARVVPGIKRAPYDPTTPRTSVLYRQAVRAIRKRASDA